MFGSSRSLLFPTPQHSTESPLLRDIGISTIHQISFRLSTINQDNNLAMLGGGKEKKKQLEINSAAEKRNTRRVIAKNEDVISWVRNRSNKHAERAPTPLGARQRRHIHFLQSG